MTEEQMKGQMSLFDQDTWFGKMSPEPCPQTKEKTSAASSKRQPKSSRKMPQYLDLTNPGAMPDALWEMGGALLGEYTMHSFGESPKEENASLLSQILVDDPLPKYSLSAKACQGILNRAERRGKKLPEILRKALENQVGESNLEQPQG